MDGKGDSLDRRIARLATAQRGVVSRAQLTRLGLGSQAIEDRLADGRLHSLHRGVYMVGHSSISREGRWLGAVLACGRGAALSHTDGAAHWGMRAASGGRIHVSVPTNSGIHQRKGICVHRPRTLLASEVTRHEGIPVTTPARTLLDLATMLRPAPLERAVEQSLSLRLFDLAAAIDVLDAHPRRAGARTLREIVARIADEPQLTRSEAEDLFLDVLATHAIDTPAVNSRVEGLEVDFAWREQQVVVEIDGHRYHATRTAFERDRARDASLTASGQRVLRFTYRQLANEPARVAEIVLKVLARA